MIRHCLSIGWILWLALSGCSARKDIDPMPPVEVIIEEELISIQVTINEQTYSAKLFNNETTQALINQFPLEIEMNELNGNEKYYYLTTDLVTNPSLPPTINKGDLMLYGNNCLVLFYESFNTSFQYTKLGYLENISDLNVGSESIEVRMYIQ